MLFKALFLLIILYYVVKTTRRLLSAVRTDGAGAGRGHLNSEPNPPSGWQGTRTPRRTGEENVEDAKWRDL